MNTENVVAIATRGLYDDMRAHGIPEHCQDALASYILEHKPEAFSTIFCLMICRLLFHLLIISIPKQSATM